MRWPADKKRRACDPISSSSRLWDLLEGAQQLSADSTACCGGDWMGVHLLIFLRGRTLFRVEVSSRLPQPPIRIKAMEFSARRSPAPGAIRHPRKPSSSTGCVHAIENLQATGYPNWGQHLVAHSRLAGRTRGERTGTGRLRSVVFPSTQCGSRPGQQHYANSRSGSKSTWSFIT